MPRIVSFNIEDIKNNHLEQSTKQNQTIQKVACCKEKNTESLDVSLIECFWGNNIDRIAATTVALKQLMKFKHLYGFEWIFVEAQENESAAVFKWLQAYGIKYIFKKIQKKSQHIWLKMPLWNICANHAKNKKLLFIDSDVYFLDDTWLKKASECLDNKDVISLSKLVKYDGSNTTFETIGFQIAAKAQREDEYGHSGFTLGMTKNAFKMLKGFDAVNYLDDQWLWMKITGKTNMTSKQFLLPYEPDDSYKNGYPFEVGYVDSTCFHYNHGNENSDRYKVLNYASYFHFKPFDDIKYNKCKPEKLPEWKNSFAGIVMKKMFQKLDETGKLAKEDFADAVRSSCKKISTSSPLIIATMYWPDYLHKKPDCILELKSKLDKYCKNKYTFICFSNYDIDNVDTIKYKQLDTKQASIDAALSDPCIEYPQNASIAFIDVTENIDSEFELYRCPNDISSRNSICKIFDNFKQLRYFNAEENKNSAMKKNMKTRTSKLRS